MIKHVTRKRTACAMIAAALLLQACGGTALPADDRAAQAPAAGAESLAPWKAQSATSLAFEWSANGFEQIDARYQWSGSGVRDDVFEPNLSLSVPETDDAIWSSSCTAGGKVETQLYLAPPKGMKGNQAVFRFDTDQSSGTRTYPARYVANGQYDGFAIVQSASDSMFTDMKAGKWAYIQIGEGSAATKLRVSLAGAKRSLGAFLPACSGAAKAARPVAATTTAAYLCEDGRAITANYLGNDTDTTVARLTIDGQVVLLAQAISGSGARYEGESSGKRITWLTKGDDGFLIAAGVDDADGASEQTARCLAR